MQETILLERKDLRQQAIERTEVLNKVKELFLIPRLEVMTMQQVADYYKVPKQTIDSCYNYNMDEVKQDGTTLKSYKDFLNLGFQVLEKHRGKVIVQLSDTTTLEIPNRGIRCFSKRAILRIGMLLRDSTVAKEVRTQLLNTFDKTNYEIKVQDINEEIKLQSDIGKAYCSGDMEEFAKASQAYVAFQNRHITMLHETNNELSENNKALAGEILKWQDRSCINRAVRLIANKCNTNFGYIWTELYKELSYKHHIGLPKRGKPPYIQYVKEDEWPKVQQSLSAICEVRGLSSSKIMRDAKIDEL